MEAALTSDYERLDLSHDLLNLRYTLTSGQAFRWRLDSDGFWSAPVKGQVIRIREDDSGFLWQTYPEPANYAILEEYFRLDDDVEAAYKAISEADERIAGLVEKYKGLRFLRQDPEECLLSFVCSAANSIPRIMCSVEALSERYGGFIAEVGARRQFSFPGAQVIAEAKPDDLANTCSLGFRGLNLKGVANQVAQKPVDWLISLRDRSYEEARMELMTLRGIGPKISDCVCLFALNKDESVPVDTHVRQIAARLYLPDMKAKSVTAGVYERVIRVFQERFGKYAGWAQQFLYMEDIQPKGTTPQIPR